jgi:hypothetical protein
MRGDSMKGKIFTAPEAMATISRLNEVVAMQKNLLIELEIELLTKGIGCKKIEEILEKSQKILGE